MNQRKKNIFWSNPYGSEPAKKKLGVIQMD